MTHHFNTQFLVFNTQFLVFDTEFLVFNANSSVLLTGGGDGDALLAAAPRWDVGRVRRHRQQRGGEQLEGGRRQRGGVPRIAK